MKRLIVIVTLLIGLGMALSAGPKAHKGQDLVFKHYVSTQEALAGDNFNKAKSSLELLAKHSDGEIKKLSETALKAGDLNALRQAFKPLSELIVKTKLPAGLAVAYCPMAKVHWVQENGKVANPYYGASMLRCGTIKKVSEKGKKISLTPFS